MSYLESKYALLAGYYLRNFKRINSVYNFSCPFCGDSEKDKHKARGYILEKSGKVIYYCHNCGIGRSFTSLLKHVSASLYSDYLLDKLKTSTTRRLPDDSAFITKQPVFRDTSQLLHLTSIEDVVDSDIARKLAIERRIPSAYFSVLYTCPYFKEWINTIKPQTFNAKSLKYDDHRLVIPFFNENKQCTAIQGRAVDKKIKPKYITISLVDEHPIFGLDRIDKSKDIFVLEGPIDAMMLSNSVAMAGSSLTSVESFLPKEKVILIYDNEPRNKIIVDSMLRAISKGYRLFIWPSGIRYKDLNEWVISECYDNPSEKLMLTIMSRVYHGLEANLKVCEWEKI
jgi:hypothetical protein